MTDPITSVSNPRIKHIRSLLANRKDRKRERMFVIEGIRAVEEALKSSTRIETLVYEPVHLGSTERGQALLQQMQDRREAHEAGTDVLAAVSDTVTPQGVVAIVAWPEPAERRAGVQLVLDALQDPGNVGTLLRSADATGVTQVLCLRGTADLYAPKVARAAMGAHFRLPMQQDLGWDELALALLPYDNIYVTDARAAMPYYAADWRQPCVLVIGNEANGVSDEARAWASKLITIPMAEGVESLNAAVAGSVVLFEAARQRRLGRS